MPAVRAAEAARTPKSALGKVHPVADGASDAVIFDPFNVRLIDAALIDQVLHKPSDWIVGKRGHDRGVEAKASFQPARDVILSAAFPHFE